MARVRVRSTQSTLYIRLSTPVRWLHCPGFPTTCAKMNFSVFSYFRKHLVHNMVNFVKLAPQSNCFSFLPDKRRQFFVFSFFSIFPGVFDFFSDFRFFRFLPFFVSTFPNKGDLKIRRTIWRSLNITK